MRLRSGILGDDEYEYDAPIGAQEPEAWAPPPQEEEAKEEPIQVEEYMPPCLLEVEAIRLAMEQSEILELSQWDDLGLQLHASRLGITIACSSDPAPCVGQMVRLRGAAPQPPLPAHAPSPGGCQWWPGCSPRIRRRTSTSPRTATTMSRRRPPQPKTLVLGVLNYVFLFSSIM
jgi:hypothetical protein